MILGATLIALVLDAVSVDIAIALVLAGVLGLLWPENDPVLGSDRGPSAEFFAKYRDGAVSVAAGMPNPHDHRTALGLMAVAALAVVLGACGDQTSAQRLAGEKAALLEAQCLAATARKTAAEAKSGDDDITKAATAADIASKELSDNPACQAALDSAEIGRAHV